jgi:hypothetical protein
MDLFNASFGVLTVAAHLPLADGAAWTRNDDTGHNITFFQTAARPRVKNAPE